VRTLVAVCFRHLVWKRLHVQILYSGEEILVVSSLEVRLPSWPLGMQSCIDIDVSLQRGYYYIYVPLKEFWTEVEMMVREPPEKLFLVVSFNSNLSSIITLFMRREFLYWAFLPSQSIYESRFFFFWK
jgi:hypothetical protein